MTTFISDPLRDASDVFAGFLYQIDRTVQRWLDIKDNELLELERGEDLDVIQFGMEDVPETRTLEQIKRRSTTSVSMKSTDALAAIAHFCEPIGSPTSAATLVQAARSYGSPRYDTSNSATSRLFQGCSPTVHRRDDSVSRKGRKTSFGQDTSSSLMRKNFMTCTDV